MVLAFEKVARSKRNSLPLLHKSTRLDFQIPTPNAGNNNSSVSGSSPKLHSSSKKGAEYYEKKLNDLKSKLKVLEEDFKFFNSNAEIAEAQKLVPQIQAIKLRISSAEKKLRILQSAEFDESKFSVMHKKSDHNLSESHKGLVSTQRIQVNL